MPRCPTGGNQGGQAPADKLQPIYENRPIPVACLVCPGALRYRPATFQRAGPPRAPKLRRNNNDEARHAPELPHHQGGDDRRYRVHHPHHLGQAGRYAAPRYRPEIAPGLDRRPATAARSRRPAVAVPEEVRGARPQEIKLPATAWPEPPRRRGLWLFPTGSLLFLLEGGPEQAELALHRIAALDAGRRGVDG